MNLKTLHTTDKPVSAMALFTGEEGTVKAIRILANQQLKKHLTKTPALLACVEGKVVFSNEKGLQETLTPGDYIHIEPMVNHWVDALEDSHLLLCK